MIRSCSFLHVPPDILLGDVIITGNPEDDLRCSFLFSHRVHRSISFVSVPANRISINLFLNFRNFNLANCHIQ